MRWFKKSPTTAEITAKLDPWLLACAVGAKNGSIYGPIRSRGLITFDTWLSVVNRDKWQDIGFTVAAIEKALRAYAVEHSSLDIEAVLKMEQTRRAS